MKKEYQESNLHKKNIKIHGRLWKVYTLALVVSFVIIYIRG
ncbi:MULTISPECIES: hypothetical protein [Arcobacteraceae]|nr:MULTISPECIES: hypothetical protein [unclassified Arcobacter]